MLYSTKYISIS